MNATKTTALRSAVNRSMPTPSAGWTGTIVRLVYALLFMTLLVFAPPARRERLSLDKVLVPRLPWWRIVSEPHAIDRVERAPRMEPVAVGEHLLGQEEAAPPAPRHAKPGS